MGSRGDSYDALAESVIGLHKTEVINRRGPWRTVGAVELATLEWVDWFNHRRLLALIGYVLPSSAKKSTIVARRLQPSWRSHVMSSLENPIRFRPCSVKTKRHSMP